LVEGEGRARTSLLAGNVLVLLGLTNAFLLLLLEFRIDGIDGFELKVDTTTAKRTGTSVGATTADAALLLLGSYKGIRSISTNISFIDSKGKKVLAGTPWMQNLKLPSSLAVISNSPGVLSILGFDHTVFWRGSRI